jgi:hypothetical protein
MSSSEVAEAPELNSSRKVLRHWFSRVVALVYGLVMFEVVLIVSPFAFYFYAAYGPTLKWLNHSTATAWLTGFLLPHAVLTTSPFLEFLPWDLGRIRAGISGVPCAGSPDLRLEVTRSKNGELRRLSLRPASSISEPWDLCFGLFTLWPRVIIFLLLVGMLFAYYFLARVEERRMLAMDPSYTDYMPRTGIFFPGNPGGGA